MEEMKKERKRVVREVGGAKRKLESREIKINDAQKSLVGSINDKRRRTDGEGSGKGNGKGFP